MKRHWDMNPKSLSLHVYIYDPSYCKITIKLSSYLLT